MWLHTFLGVLQFPRGYFSVSDGWLSQTNAEGLHQCAVDTGNMDPNNITDLVCDSG